MYACCQDGGSLLSLIHTKPGDVAGLKAQFLHVFIRGEKNEMKGPSWSFLAACIATRLMQIADEKLNHVPAWLCFL